MSAVAPQTTHKTKSLTILQRIAEKDKTAVQDCIDTYGNFIWALARKFTNSTEEAENATQKIFMDIWRYAERADKAQSDENLLIVRIARRRLIKPLAVSQTKSMNGIDTKNEQGADTEFPNNSEIPCFNKVVKKTYEKS